MSVQDATIDLDDESDDRFSGLVGRNSQSDGDTAMRLSGRHAFFDAGQKRDCVRPPMYNKPNTGDLDLNMIGSSGFNCLHAACGSGNIEMTEYLLKKR